MHYYLRKGQTNKAEALANSAADVYSEAGLRTKAEFFEAIGKFADAFEWYKNIEERYGRSSRLITFALRYKEKTGDSRYDREIEARMDKLFPKGQQKVKVQDFSVPPTDGVLINGENNLVRDAGLKKGDVIVALDGVRVHNTDQYTYLRALGGTAELKLIVWVGGNMYRDVVANAPNRKFGVGIATYRRN